MASRFLNSLKINDAYTLPSSDGSNGQVIVTDGSGNLAFADPSTSSSASVIYRDNFTGDGSTVAFTLQNSLSDEDQTFIYIDGVYQEKGTYSLSTNTITFTTAPDTGHSIEVISISGINVGPTTIYQDNFTGDGTTTNFTLAQVVDNEVKTMIYFNGVYQFKGTYSLNGTALSFDTAPANGVDIEVISIASAAAADYNQKVLFYGKANEAISKGDAIMLAGQEGDHFLLAKATQAAISVNHEYFLGLASQDLAQGEFGYVTEFGKITELDTSGYTAGDILWFDSGGSTAGALTTTEPAAPLAKIQVAAVIRSHQNEGVLFIRPSWYHELGELHDVNVTSVADKDLLVWDNANGYWENSKSLGDITTGYINYRSVASVPSESAFVYSPADEFLAFGTGGSERIRIDDGGYVGIGTSSPSQKLDVNGYARSTSGFVGSSGLSLFGDNSSTERVFVTTGGSVGIGTTSPSGKLHVNSGIAHNNIYFTTGSSGGTGYDVRLYLNGGANNSEMSINMGIVGNEDRDRIRTYQGNMYFRTNDSENMTITSGGNVGIGTTSPQNNLHIESTSPTIRLSDSNSTSTSTVSSTIQFWDRNNTARAGYLGYASTTNPDFGIKNEIADGDVWIAAGDVERMRIDSLGVFQLTESSANGYLNANGTDLEIDVNRHPETGTFSDTTKGHARIALRAEDAGAGSRIIFSTASTANTPGTERMRINSTGNIGIGTTSPTKTLDVNGAIRSRSSFNLSDGTTQIGGLFKYKDITGAGTDNSGVLFSETGLDLHFMTGGSATSKMVIQSGGNVGIGTTSPLNKLSVVVSDTFGYYDRSDATVVIQDVSPTLLIAHDGNATNEYAELRLGNNQVTYYPYSAYIRGVQGSGIDQYSLEFGVANYGHASTKMALSKDGKLGIGTTSPQAKLHVEGDISQTSNSKTIVFSKTLSDNVGTDIAGFTGYTGDPSAATILVTVVVNASSGYAVETHRYLWNLRKATAGRSRSVTTLTGADQGSVNSGVVSIVSVTPVALYNSYERFRLSVNLSGISTCVVYVKMEALGENIQGLNPM